VASVAAFIRILMYLLVSIVAPGAAIFAQTAHFTSATATLPIGKLTNPNGMAIDANGDVYVTDTAANSIAVVAPLGTLYVGNYVTPDGSPYGIAVDAHFNIYITDNVKNEVMKWTIYPHGS
jgi:sugar lactone lactonase YvrE